MLRTFFRKKTKRLRLTSNSDVNSSVVHTSLDDWQVQYEPIIQAACIEASAKGLELIRVEKKTGIIENSNFAVSPIPMPEVGQVIKKMVSSDAVFDEDKNHWIIRWDEYPDE